MYAPAVSEWSAMSSDFIINSGNDFMYAPAVSEWSAMSSDFIINSGNDYMQASALSWFYMICL